MSQRKTKQITSIFACLFFGAMLLSGCGGADDSGRDDESAGADESAGVDEAVGEADDALTKASTSGGGGDHCGYFCPWWAKDLSDCLMIPC
jgi:hypothetical protein